MPLETVVIKITGDSKDLNKTIDQLEKVGKVDRQNAKSFKKTSKQMGSGFDSLKGKALALGGTMIGAFAIQQVISSAITTLKNFEKELSTLQSITGSTAKEMEFFSQAAKDIGRDTKTSATEVVKAFTLIGSAQPELLKNSKALAEVSKQALILGKAAGIDASAAATALTSAMNQFGVSAKDAAKFTDIFATSQQKGSSFIAATSEALINVGAVASAAGLSFETTNAAIQALAKGAITGSRAGTALRGVLSKLSSQTDDTINPSMIGLGDTITELAKRNLTLKDATKLVGEEGATGLLTLIKQKDIYFELDGALNETGNAMAQMEINTDNLDGSLEDLGNNWEIFILGLSGSDGVLKDTTDAFSDFLFILTERGLIDALASFAGGAWGVTTAMKDQIKVEKEIANLEEQRTADLKEIIALNLNEAISIEKLNDLKGKANFTEKELNKLRINSTITYTEYGKALNSIKAIQDGSIEIIKELTEEEKKLKQIQEDRTKTIGDLQKELKALRDAQKSLIPGSEALLENQKRVKEIQAILKGEIIKSISPVKMLQQEIAKLKTRLEEQALAGDVSSVTLKKYNDLIKKLKTAQDLLNEAIGKTPEQLKKEEEALANLAAKQATAKNKGIALEKRQQDEIDKTFSLSAELGVDFVGLMAEFYASDFDNFQEFEEAKRNEVRKTEDERIAKIEQTIANISEVEQSLSAIIGQVNENKLIAIDNEETKALKSLEAQGLGEEELAKKQKEIQDKAERERAVILRKQFIADKISAITQVAINTALAVTRALASTANPIFAAFIGGLGLVQAGVIAAQPIPEFHEGKKAELKDDEIYAKILKSESVIPPEQSKKYKGAIDSMIDKKYEDYVFQEYMLPMMKSMSKKDSSPYNDVHLWNNQKKQIRLMQESNGLAKAMIKALDMGSQRRSW